MSIFLLVYIIISRIWVSPRFPLKSKDNKSDGDSKTGFKKDILRYLRSYSEPLLNQWIQKIENSDFSEAKYVYRLYILNINLYMKF